MANVNRVHFSPEAVRQLVELGVIEEGDDEPGVMNRAITDYYNERNVAENAALFDPQEDYHPNYPPINWPVHGEVVLLIASLETLPGNLVLVTGIEVAP